MFTYISSVFGIIAFELYDLRQTFSFHQLLTIVCWNFGPFPPGGPGGTESGLWDNLPAHNFWAQNSYKIEIRASRWPLQNSDFDVLLSHFISFWSWWQPLISKTMEQQDVYNCVLSSIGWISNFMMLQVFSTGERAGLQAGQFSSWTLLLWSHAVVMDAVCGWALSCWNMQAPPWKRCCLDGSICCSKTSAYSSALMISFQMWKLLTT